MPIQYDIDNTHIGDTLGCDILDSSTHL